MLADVLLVSLLILKHMRPPAEQINSQDRPFNKEFSTN